MLSRSLAEYKIVKMGIFFGKKKQTEGFLRRKQFSNIFAPPRGIFLKILVRFSKILSFVTSALNLP